MTTILANLSRWWADTPLKRRQKTCGKPFSLLQAGVHLFAQAPAAWLLADAAAGRLSINPIQEATQRLGQYAILLLVASLAITPLKTITGSRAIPNLARPLGLYAFGYALIHLIFFVGVDYGFNFALLLPDTLDKPYIYIGLAAFLILLSLAVTSFRWWMKHLGKRWKVLHRLVYVAGVLVVIHYGMAVKGDLLTLRGNIGMPVFYGVLVALLLVVRLPIVRRWVVTGRGRIQHLTRSKRNEV